MNYYLKDIEKGMPKQFWHVIKMYSTESKTPIRKLILDLLYRGVYLNNMRFINDKQN